MNIKQKKRLSWFGMFLGIALAAGGWVIGAKFETLQGLGLGMCYLGAPLAGGCIGFLYKARYQPEKLRRHEIEQKDERNQLVRGKAAYIALCVSLYMVMVLAITLINTAGYKTIGYILFGAGFLQLACFFIAKKVFEKRM